MPGCDSEPVLCQCGRPIKHPGICRGTRRLYHHTPETDALIREAYDKLRRFGNRRAVPALRVKLGWPKHVINKRAREIGLAKTKERPWTTEEKALLETWSHLALPCIWRKFRQAGFERTETGIKLKMRRMLITKDALDYLSATRIALGLGIDSHKVMGWIRQGWLRAQAKGTVRTKQQGGDIHLAHVSDLRRFLLHHPDEYELGPVEKFWFIDVLSGGRLCEEYRKEVA